jgi:hypothetical protein
MRSDAKGIIGYKNLAEVTPFVSLAHPVLKQADKKTSYYSES